MTDGAPFADPALRLRERRDEALAELAANEESARPPSLDEEIGRLTRMDALQQQQMALHARRRIEVRIARIDGALARVEAGTFGACAMCGDAVDPRRLESAPETPFCLACQTRIESKGGGR